MFRHRLKLAATTIACAAAAAAFSASAGYALRTTAPAPAATTTSSSATAPQSDDLSFRSPALLGDEHVVVDLPAGYASSGLHYPVVYFLHGLPALPTTYQTFRWLQRTMTTLPTPAILVVPQATRRRHGDPEFQDWGPGRDWSAAIARDLVHFVDANFRTIANRSARALIGYSAGGYGASSIGLSHPAVFSVVESWSGYFQPTDPTGRHVLDLGSAGANAAASLYARAPALRLQFRRYPTFFAFYAGRSDPDVGPANLKLHELLGRLHVPHTYETYPGGHTFALWKAHAAAWLALALQHLSAPR